MEVASACAPACRMLSRGKARLDQGEKQSPSLRTSHGELPLALYRAPRQKKKRSQINNIFAQKQLGAGWTI